MCLGLTTGTQPGARLARAVILYIHLKADSGQLSRLGLKI